MERRYGTVDPVVQERLDYELSVITSQDFSGYFLIVWDLVNYARNQGISVGPGRGSAAGCLASYCLGITNIDPIKYDLIFERFLNPERIEPPDIDIDFDDTRRDEVLRYVVDKYGKDNVSQVITFGTWGLKRSVRDVGRVLGMPFGEVDRIAKQVPTELKITLDKAIERVPELQQVAASARRRRQADRIRPQAGGHGAPRLGPRLRGHHVAPGELTDYRAALSLPQRRDYNHPVRRRDLHGRDIGSAEDGHLGLDGAIAGRGGRAADSSQGAGL